jgi:hypothetical protein
VEVVPTDEGEVPVMKRGGKDLGEMFQVDKVAFHCFPVLIIKEFLEGLKVHRFLLSFHHHR